MLEKIVKRKLTAGDVSSRKHGQHNFYCHLASDQDVDQQMKKKETAAAENGLIGHLVTPRIPVSIDLDSIQSLEFETDAQSGSDRGAAKERLIT